jgi:hypothetical protein
MTARFAFRIRQTAFAVLASSAILATACAGSSPTGPSTGTSSSTGGTSSQTGSPVGTYRLTMVDGKNVPCVFDSYSPGPGVTLQMQAKEGQLRLNSDGTYLEQISTRLETGPLNRDIDTTTVVDGLYSLQGTTLALAPNGGSAFKPGYSAGRIDIVAEAPGLDGGVDRVTFTFTR